MISLSFKLVSDQSLIGSSERFSYTVTGDGVNVAARLEGVNKTFGTTICISDSVYEAVAGKIVARPLRRVQVKGRKQASMIMSCLESPTATTRNLQPAPMTRNCAR